MLNRKANNPNFELHERVSQYRAKRILHAGFKNYRATFGDSSAEIADYLGWSESKLRQMVYHNFYARRTEDIRLLCRLFQVDADEATRPYCEKRDVELALKVMAMDDEREQTNVEPLFPEQEQDPLEDTQPYRTALRNVLNDSITELNAHMKFDGLTDQEVCELVSIRAETMTQTNLLELTKDLMMLGMTRGTQRELPLPDFE